MHNLKHLFFNHVAQTSDSPLAIQVTKAQGVKIFDFEGKDYIDLISGVSVSNLGHNHPNIINAVQDQLGKYMHLMVYGEFVEEPQVLLANTLASILPPNLETTYFLNGGSEAIEAALKIAKRYTRRHEIVSFKNAYHGSTVGALSLMHDSYFKNAFEPLVPGHKHIRYNDFEELSEINFKTAAVVVEPVQGEAGVICPDPGFLEALSKRCQEVGALLIFDEIQTGFGRTGKMFAFEHSNAKPDMLVLAKALGGGMPLGAVISSKEIISCLISSPVLGHITTFGGHPISCAAGLASLSFLLENNNLINETNEKADLFIAKISGSKLVKTIRHKGLLMAVDFESKDLLKKSIPLFIKNGLITDWFLFNETSFRISPPLTITFDEIEDATRRIKLTLNELENIY